MVSSGAVAEGMQRLIDRADSGKLREARERLEQESGHDDYVRLPVVARYLQARLRCRPEARTLVAGFFSC